MSAVQEEAQVLAAKTLWQYLLLAQTLEKSDVIIGLGSLDRFVAQYVGLLYQRGYADHVLFTGGVRHFHQDWRGLTEAQYFANILFQETNISKEKVLLEVESTNTGENIKMSYSLLQSYNLPIKAILVVSKPHLQRRVWAALQKQWPDKTTSISVTAPPVSYEVYLRDIHNSYSKEDFRSVLVKNLRKIIEYPKYGYQIEQEIPRNVLNAYHFLISKGYG